MENRETIYNEEDMQDYAKYCIFCYRQKLSLITVKGWFNNIKNKCKKCNGTGVVAYSCCGDVIYDDTELCPTCKEFVGYEEEECECQTVKQQKDDYAISFAEWISTQGYKEYSNGWAKLWDKGLYTTQELLQQFNK